MVLATLTGLGLQTVFQYPLYRIVEWFYVRVSTDKQASEFQYPLYRIVEWFEAIAQAKKTVGEFQYPLYRIVEWFLDFYGQD